MLMKKALMNLLKQSRMSPLRLTNFSTKDSEDSYGEYEDEAPVQQKVFFKPRVFLPFQIEAFEVFLKSEKNQIIGNFITLKAEGEFSEYVAHAINSLDTKDGFAFWSKLDADEKNKVISNIIEIKQEYFGSSNRTVNKDFLFVLMRVCNQTESFDLLSETSKILFENYKSRALKMNFIQNFFTNGEKCKLKKNNQIVQETVRFFETRLIEILFAEDSNYFDYKFINIACRTVTDYMAFILNRYPSPSQNTSRIASFIFQNKIDTLNFYSMIKGTCLILEMMNKKMYKQKITDEYNLDFFNEMVFCRKEIAVKYGTKKDVESLDFVKKIELGKNILSETYNYFLQGLFLKNESSWENRISPFYMYSNSAQFFFPKADFGKWMISILSKENIEELNKTQLNQMIQVVTSLSLLSQGRQMKIKLIKFYQPYLKSIKNKNELINHLKLVASFLPTSPNSEDFNTDKNYELTDAEEQTVEEYKNEVMSLLESESNQTMDPFSIMELIHLLMNRFKTLSQKDLKNSWLHESFMKIISKKNNISIYLVKILNTFDCYDLNDNTDMIKKFGDVLLLIEQILIKYSLSFSSYERKRIRLLFTKLEEQIKKSQNSENKAILEDLETILVRIEKIKFVRKE